MNKDSITKAFINEILTGIRTAKLQKFLDNSSEEIIAQAYVTALKELEIQRFALADLYALQFITVDANGNSSSNNFSFNIAHASLSIETMHLLSQQLNFLAAELEMEKQAFFFVKVKGNSMINSNINNGDIIIATKTINAKHNDIIIAQIGEHYYVKRYRIIDDKQWLFSENDLFPPVLVDASMNFHIIGNVIKTVAHTAIENN